MSDDAPAFTAADYRAEIDRLRAANALLEKTVKIQVAEIDRLAAIAQKAWTATPERPASHERPAP